MKAALVGLGYWGKIILSIIKSLEESLGFKLEHVCDCLEDNLIDCKKRYPLINAHFDFDKLIDSEKIDLVFITTGIDTHYNLVKKSLENGCHTFVEKPFVLNVDQAFELDELAKSKSLTLMVGHRLLYSPSIQWLKNNTFANAVPDGTIFEASWKNWGIHQPYGVHWDLACHYIAVSNYFMESIPEILSVTPIATSSSGNVENVSICLEYPQNSIVKIDVSWNNPFRRKELILKTPGQLIYIEHESDYPLIVYEAKAILKYQNNQVYYKTNFSLQNKYNKRILNEMQTIEAQFTDFVKSIKTGKSVLASADLAIGVVKTLCQIDSALY